MAKLKDPLSAQTPSERKDELPSLSDTSDERMVSSESVPPPLMGKSVPKAAKKGLDVVDAPLPQPSNSTDEDQKLDDDEGIIL